MSFVGVVPAPKKSVRDNLSVTADDRSAELRFSQPPQKPPDRRGNEPALFGHDQRRHCITLIPTAHSLSEIVPDTFFHAAHRRRF
jgi:hypothetical protein